ncbi:hypothetical protein JCM19233_331 [Vibrio astriarenae]|nr:hypothetical protein JCM19233_331 [Vibrio sp. C7]
MSLFVDNAIAGWIQKAEKSGELKNNAYRAKPSIMMSTFKHLLNTV